MLNIRAYDDVLLTYPVTPTGPIPTAQDPEGVYPYESFCETARRPILKAYRFIALENNQIRAVICPDLGGKVFSLLHKASGKEALYVAPVVRPIRILPRQAYVGGGIEVSFPISHTPVQIESVLVDARAEGNRAYVWCGEQEVRFGMHWTVEYSLGPGDTFLTQRTAFYNPTKTAWPWMSWSNAGIPARPDTEFHFPNGEVLCHGDSMKTIDWATEGPKRQSAVNRMIGFFWHKPDCCAFGAFTPSLGTGLYHVADPALTPGIKLWTDGVGPHEAFVTQWTLNREQCLEIQAGPIVDQSIKATLAPAKTHMHVEFWIPSDRPLDIHAIPLPESRLPPIETVPWFGFARSDEMAVWCRTVSAWQSDDVESLPNPPSITDNHWAPSGMETLEQALPWAVKATDGETADRWLLQWGSWLAGRDRIDAALAVLTRSHDDRARALAGRLYRRNKHDFAAAAACFRALRSTVFARHHQVVYERDLALAGLGQQTHPSKYPFWNTERFQQQGVLVHRLWKGAIHVDAHTALDSRCRVGDRTRRCRQSGPGR